MLIIIPKCKLVEKNRDQYSCLQIMSSIFYVRTSLHFLDTSGTTGQPKGIVRDCGGTTVALNWVMDKVFNVQTGSTFFAASDIGWVVGHSFIIYGPLIRGAASVVFEGKPVGTPDAGTFWRVASQHNCHCIYAAPTAIRIIKKLDYEGKEMKKYDLSKLRTFHLVGERSDPDTIRWLTEKFPGVFLNDSYWQTETGWPICSNFDNLHKFPTKAGSATKPCVGYEVEILGSDPDDHDTFNKPVPAGVLGNVSIKLPMPPSFMLTLWKNDEFFIQKYLTESPGYYHSGDAGNIDEDGYLHIMTRTDDVLNCAGHRLSAG